MHPVLFTLGPYVAYTYVYIHIIAFTLCYFAVFRPLVVKSGMNLESAENAGIGGIIAGLLGNRVLGILSDFSYYLKNPAEMFGIGTNTAFYGAPIAGFFFLLLYTRLKKLPPLKMTDVGVVTLCLGQAIGRIGCFFAGCCHGTATSHWWGISLESPLVESSLRGVPLHPVQLYESAVMFGLYFGLRHVLLNRSKFDGHVTMLYFAAYAIARFILEFFRGDSIRGYVGVPYLSTSQFISVLIFGAVAGLYFRRLRGTKLLHER